MPAPPAPPFYLDWTFWAFVVAALAVALSQLPPLRLAFRAAELRIEVYSILCLTLHQAAPRAQLHVILRNTGGRTLRVRRLRLLFKCGSTELELPAVGYFVNTNDQQPALLVPFTLPPDGEWAHILNCFMPPDQPKLRRLKTLLAPLKPDIRAKRAGLPPNAPDVEISPELLAPILSYFNQEFKWEHGEYQLTVQAAWDANRITERHFRFTLFESDSQDLRNFADDYKYGSGLIYPNKPERDAVFAALSQAPVDDS